MINVAKPHPIKSDEKRLYNKSQVKTAKMPGSVQSHLMDIWFEHMERYSHFPGRKSFFSFTFLLENSNQIF